MEIIAETTDKVVRYKSLEGFVSEIKAYIPGLVSIKIVVNGDKPVIKEKKPGIKIKNDVDENILKFLKGSSAGCKLRNIAKSLKLDAPYLSQRLWLLKNSGKVENKNSLWRLMVSHETKPKETNKRFYCQADEKFIESGSCDPTDNKVCNACRHNQGVS